MAALMYLTASGASVWKQRGGAWVPAELQAGESLRVVTNLAEEALSDLAVPKLGPQDRARFIQRQLANRFPGNPFALAAPRTRGRKFGAAHQGLAAIDPPDRLRAALAERGAELAGVYCSGLLLATLAAQASRSPNVMAAAMTDAGMRVVALIDGAAVLTRLVQGANTPEDQAGEILRTVRHLENTRLLERDGRPLDALLLGIHPDTAALLAQDRLRVVPPPRGQAPWNLDVPTPLLDAVRRSPQLQMAAPSERMSHLLRRLRHAGWAACAAAAVAALALAWGLWGQGRSTRGSVAEFNAQLATIQAATAELDTQLAAQPLSPALLRELHLQYETQLGAVPPMWPDLEKLSRVIESESALRLARIQWRRLAAGEMACQSAGARGPGAAPSTVPMAGTAPQGMAAMQAPMAPMAPMAATAPEAADSAVPPPMLELSFQSQPDLLDLEQQIQRATALAQRLRQWPGAQVLASPLSVLREGELKGGAGRSASEPPGLWCLSLTAPAHAAAPGHAANERPRVAGGEP
jgi:hypothetical protein